MKTYARAALVFVALIAIAAALYRVIGGTADHRTQTRSVEAVDEHAAAVQESPAPAPAVETPQQPVSIAPTPAPEPAPAVAPHSDAPPAPTALPVANSTKPVRIPELSARYRMQLEREATAEWGLSAPVARVAAQLHQESAWRADARSPYAQGLAQFTPSTAAWLPDVCPDVGEPDPWDAGWSIRAAVCYDAYLYARVAAHDDCSRWAMTLSAYNGGLGWLRRDVALATQRGADPLTWFGAVELHTSRAAWARDENRAYPRRILLVLEPAYIAAGWPGKAVCT